MTPRRPKIENVAPGLLHPYPGNPRTHPKRQVRQIAANIREFGFTNPILIDEANTIIAGHGRLEAARLLGLETVPVICLRGLSEAQKRALVIADNKLAENAHWDPDLLAKQLQELVELDFDLDLTGFETPELDILLGHSGSVTAEQDEDDELVEPERGAPPISRANDLWLLGPHRLLCANALQAESYERLLGSDKAEMVVGDPPYNAPIDGHVCGLGKIHHPEFKMASGEMSETEFADFLKTAMEHLVRYSIDGSLHFLFMDWRGLFAMLTAARGTYTEQKNLCIWSKTNGGMGSLYRSQHELVAVFKNGRAPHINNVELGRRGRYRTNVWHYPGVNTFRKDRLQDLAAHPTVKPIGLIADAILDCSKVGGLILDPFAGSGTTILACERTKRLAAAMEIDPHYVDVAIRRFQNRSRVPAMHAETGLTFDGVRALRATACHEVAS